MRLTNSQLEAQLQKIRQLNETYEGLLGSLCAIGIGLILLAVALAAR